MVVNKVYRVSLGPVPATGSAIRKNQINKHGQTTRQQRALDGCAWALMLPSSASTLPRIMTTLQATRTIHPGAVSSLLDTRVSYRMHI